MKMSKAMLSVFALVALCVAVVVDVQLSDDVSADTGDTYTVTFYDGRVLEVPAGEDLTATIDAPEKFEVIKWTVNSKIDMTKGEVFGDYSVSSSGKSLSIKAISEDVKLDFTARYISESNAPTPLVSVPFSTDVQDMVLKWTMGNGSVANKNNMWAGGSSEPLVLNDYVYIREGESIFKIESSTGLVKAVAPSSLVYAFYHQLGYLGNGLIVDYETYKVYDEDLVYQNYDIRGRVTFDDVSGLAYCLTANTVSVYNPYAIDPTDVSGGFLNPLWKVSLDAEHAPFSMNNVYSQPVILDGVVYWLNAVDLPDDGTSQTNMRSEVSLCYASGPNDIGKIRIPAADNMYLDNGWVSTDGTRIYVTSYSEGLFPVSGDGNVPANVSVVTPVLGGEAQVCSFQLEGFQLTSAFVVDGDIGFVKVGDRLFAYDVSGLSNDTPSIELLAQSEATELSHGSIAVNKYYKSYFSDPYYIYFPSYETGQLWICEYDVEAGEFACSKLSDDHTYTSQGARFTSTGNLVYYDDSGLLFCYTPLEKNSYTYLVDDGDVKECFHSIGSNAASALCSARPDWMTKDYVLLGAETSASDLSDGYTLYGLVNGVWLPVDNNYMGGFEDCEFWCITKSDVLPGTGTAWAVVGSESFFVMDYIQGYTVTSDPLDISADGVTSSYPGQVTKKKLIVSDAVGTTDDEIIEILNTKADGNSTVYSFIMPYGDVTFSQPHDYSFYLYNTVEGEDSSVNGWYSAVGSTPVEALVAALDAAGIDHPGIDPGMDSVTFSAKAYISDWSTGAWSSDGDMYGVQWAIWNYNEDDGWHLGNAFGLPCGQYQSHSSESADFVFAISHERYLDVDGPTAAASGISNAGVWPSAADFDLAYDPSLSKVEYASAEDALRAWYKATYGFGDVAGYGIYLASGDVYDDAEEAATMWMASIDVTAYSAVPGWDIANAQWGYAQLAPRDYSASPADVAFGPELALPVVGEEFVIDGIVYSVVKLSPARVSVIGAENNPEVLVIPSSVVYRGYSFAVSYAGENAFAGNEALNTVIFDDGMLRLYPGAFADCVSLTSVQMSSTLTVIDAGVFSGCLELKDINFSSALSSLSKSAFDVKFYNGTKVLYSTASFKGNHFAGEGDGKLYKDGVRVGLEFESGGLLYSVDSVKSLTASVIGYTSVFPIMDIPSSVGYFGWDFTVTTIGEEAFFGCEEIRWLTMNNGLANIGPQAFSGCTSLESISMPDTVKTIGAGAFSGCLLLKTVDFPSALSSLSKSAFDVKFYNGTKVLYSTASFKDRFFEGDGDGKLYKDGVRVGKTFSDDSLVYEVTKLNPLRVSVVWHTTDSVDIVVPSNATYGDWSFAVTSIGEGALSHNTLLRSVTISDGLTSIGVSAFYGCASLEYVAMPDTVKTISAGAFEGCLALKFINFSSALSSLSKSAFDVQFYNGTKVLYSTASHKGFSFEGTGDGKLYKDGAWKGRQFESDGLVYSIVNFNPYRVSLIGGAPSSDALVVPSSVNFGNNAFAVTSIGKSAFKGDVSLVSVTLPDSVLRIYSSAFSGCSNLISVDMGSSLATIDGSAFRGCPALEHVAFGPSLASLSSSAFPSVVFQDVNGVTLESTVDNLCGKTFEGSSGILTEVA